MKPRRVIVFVLDVVGVGAIAVAGWIVTPALGIALAGVGAIVFAELVERPSRQPPGAP